MAALTRRFGVARLADVETAVQEACARAIERGFAHLEGAELDAWLVRVAHNAMIDALRRDARSAPLDDNDPEIASLHAPARFEMDDELRLLFLACHPSLTRAAQIALTLRIAYGFTTKQIARAFLSDEAAIAQRIVRAKQRLREARATFEIPEARELPSRVEAILDVLYQSFTEGYATTENDAGIDDVLCKESLRLVRLLTDDARWATPNAEALRALFCFHCARAGARRAEDGGLLLLQEQDRTRWDARLVEEGLLCLGRSARGETFSRFHAEAGIAALHATAPSFASTDWPQIASLYEALRAIAPSPVVDVNRAFALAMCRGAAVGIDELDAIPERDLVMRYPYALATYAELHASLGHIEKALAYLHKALAMQTAPAERALLQRKVASLASRLGRE